MPRPEPTPMDRALRLLTQRGHSAAELMTKLRRAGIPERTAEATINECRRLGFINDELFARDCAAMLAARGCGRLKIRADLKRRGVAEQSAEAIAELEESELERAIEAAQFKRRLLNREKDPRKLREKLWRFLLGRGFTPDIVRDAVTKTSQESPEDDPWA